MRTESARSHYLSKLSLPLALLVCLLLAASRPVAAGPVPAGLSAADWAQISAMLPTPAVLVQQAYLKASNAGTNDSVGYAVAVAGDTVVVGAPLEASNGVDGAGGPGDNSAPQAGAAYVFTRSGATWSEQAYLKASNAEADDNFGRGVAVAGDTVVVGARYEDGNGAGGPGDNSADSAGAAYVFTRSGATWTEQAYLKASNAEEYEIFGWAVAAAGDTVVVGMPCEGECSGAAYVFVEPLASGTIVIVEEANPAGDTAFSFIEDITGGAFTLTDPPDNAVTFSDVAPGGYTVSETVPAGWSLDNIDCDDANSTGDTATATATINLEAGEMVTCTFSNSYIPIYVSAVGGRVPGAGAYQKNDILKWDGSAWSVWFDGASAGLLASADILAFDVDDPDTGSAWVVIRQAQKLPGIGKVKPQQIAAYDGSTWSRFFDGGDVGLKTSGEAINGLEVLPGSASPIGSGCLYYLLISTVAGGGVPFGATNVNFTGEDVLGFCMTSLGANTAGVWHVVFEGQAEGLQKNNSLGLCASDDAATLYFTVKKNFTGDGGLIRPSELFSFSGGIFSGPLWKAADHGLNQAVDGIDVVDSIP
jgi:hypothetical protein